jgi:small subunit ribosomal protein S20
VAHTLSAKKRIRQNVKRRALNRWRKNRVKDVVKDFENALKEGKKNEKAIAEALNACYKQLDKTAAKNTIHKNAAARKKARLTAAMNKALA